MASRGTNHRGGRPGLGAREQLASRVPVEIAAAVRAKAAELDCAVSEYLAGLIAEAHGFDRPLYERERLAQLRGEQEALPISA